MNTNSFLSHTTFMKTSTKILSILTIVSIVPSIFLFKFILEGIVPTGKSFVLNFSPMSWVALAFLLLSFVLGTILFFRFLRLQRLSTALFFSVFPLSIFYGVFVSYIASLTAMSGITAESMRATLKISAEKNNNLLWVGLATLVYLVLLFIIILLLCKPLSKVEMFAKNLGDGRMKYDDYKVGGTKQFKEIENSLNKINYQYKQKENKVKQADFGHQKGLSKQFFKFMGKESLENLELGKQVTKLATVLLFDLEKAQKNVKILSLEENFHYINSYLKVVYPFIKRYNGFVDKFLGEGVLAVFSSSQDAIECSHALFRAIEVKNKSQKDLLALSCKISIDTREVVFGIVGDDERKEPQIVSDVLSDLGKMQEINSYIGTNIIVTKNALGALSQSFQFEYRYTGVLTIDEKDAVPLYESLEILPKRKKEKIMKLKNKFEAGVRAYNQKNYKLAKDEFEYVLHYLPEDKPSYVYFNKTLEKLKESA